MKAAGQALFSQAEGITSGTLHPIKLSILGATGSHLLNEALVLGHTLRAILLRATTPRLAQAVAGTPAVVE
jgi:hypothetical protein